MITKIVAGVKGLSLTHWTLLALTAALGMSQMTNWYQRSTITDQKITITALNRELGSEKQAYRELKALNDQRNRAIAALQAAQELEREKYALGLQAAEKAADGHRKAIQSLRSATSVATDRLKRCDDALQLIVEMAK